MKRSIIILILVMASLNNLIAEEENFNVSGTIENLDQGNLYIYLTNEETSKKPFTGIQEMMIPSSQCSDRNSVSFSFKMVPPGNYGIHCFQDQNGNGKLDRGLFGPKEPWGLSWNETRTSEWPGFKNFRFTLIADKDDVRVILEERK